VTSLFRVDPRKISSALIEASSVIPLSNEPTTVFPQSKSPAGGCADRHGMHPHTDETASEACAEVNHQIACASEGHFNKRPDLEEHVPIEADMDDPEAKKAGGEQAPPLMGAYGERAVVSAQFATSRGVGWVKETRLATMAANIRTLIAIRA
jgi:hypothetical protein